MILSREITIKICENNFSYYENLGYNITLGQILTIPIELLQNGSNHKILCKCDNCGIEKDIIYKNYVKYKKNHWGEYFCRKCSESKRKETLKKNLGVEYPIQNPIIMDKRLESIKNKSENERD